MLYFIIKLSVLIKKLRKLHLRKILGSPFQAPQAKILVGLCVETTYNDYDMLVGIFVGLCVTHIMYFFIPRSTFVHKYALKYCVASPYDTNQVTY